MIKFSQRRNLRAPSLIATIFAALLGGPLPVSAEPQHELAVCADPGNLPFSNDKLEGFENKIASLIAADLRTTLRYEWRVQRRDFLRRTLLSGACDVVMGVSAGLPGVSVTRPYYTSTYVFVSVRKRKLQLGSFDAPALKNLKIGLHAIAAEGSNTPPARALAKRGIVDNIVGFSMWGEENVADPQARIITAVATGEIDTAVVWGPFAGYFAKRHGNRLVVTPVEADPQTPSFAFVYEISLGVRDGDDLLKEKLQDVLHRRKSDIEAILNEYAVPLVAGQARSSALTRH